VKPFVDAIPGAVYQEIPGNAASPWANDVELLADSVEEFVTGTKPRRVSNRVLATVLFTDLVDSTRRAADLGDRAWTDLLERHLASVRATIAAFDGQVVKPTGDGVLALLAGPAQAVRCAEAVIADAQVLGLQVRTGVHTGEIERGGDDVAGVSVHLAARIMAAAQAGEVLVSRTVRDLAIGSELAFTERGEHALKGIPDRWALYAASSAQP
jgi:class 3 adenylate cyclase